MSPESEGIINCPNCGVDMDEGGPCPRCEHVDVADRCQCRACYGPPLCVCGHREDRHDTSLGDDEPVCMEGCECRGYDGGDDDLDPEEEPQEADFSGPIAGSPEHIDELTDRALYGEEEAGDATQR